MKGVAGRTVHPGCWAPTTWAGAITWLTVGRANILCGVGLLLGLGCGFQKTAPVSNVCGLLSLADVQSLAPGLTTATEQPPEDSPDVWTRRCQFTGSGLPARVSLSVLGALTSTGDQQLADNVSGAPVPEFEVIVLSGLGDRAVYSSSFSLSSQGITAKQGEYEVGVGLLNASVLRVDLESLVRSVLGQLPER